MRPSHQSAPISRANDTGIHTWSRASPQLKARVSSGDGKPDLSPDRNDAVPNPQSAGYFGTKFPCTMLVVTTVVTGIRLGGGFADRGSGSSRTTKGSGVG